MLIDAGSLREHGTIAGKVVYDEDGQIIDWTPSNFISGRASVRGRPVMLGADDFTVRGGHQDGHVGGKQMYGERLARQYRVPMIRLLDGSSGGGSVASILKNGYSSLPLLMGFEHLVRMLDEIPVAAAALGPTVGLASARATTVHFTVGTTIPGVSQLFAAGPPVVLHATHETVTKDQLGGALMQASTGTFDNLAETEAKALEMIKDWLSYLPSNRWEMPPILPKPPKDVLEKVNWEDIIKVVPNDRKKPYDPRDYLRLVVDPGTLFEVGFASNASISPADGLTNPSVSLSQQTHRWAHTGANPKALSLVVSTATPSPSPPRTLATTQAH